MSTRARIGIVRHDGSILSIYTHNDGYISHHGPILLEHYDTTPKILALIQQGDCSRLSGCLDECIFYKRDRGNLWGDAMPLSSATSSLYLIRARQTCAEYIYLFEDSEWHVAEVPKGARPVWQDLRIATITERLTT